MRTQEFTDRLKKADERAKGSAVTNKKRTGHRGEVAKNLVKIDFAVVVVLFCFVLYRGVTRVWQMINWVI